MRVVQTSQCSKVCLGCKCLRWRHYRMELVRIFDMEIAHVLMSFIFYATSSNLYNQEKTHVNMIKSHQFFLYSLLRRVFTPNVSSK